MLEARCHLSTASGGLTRARSAGPCPGVYGDLASQAFTLRDAASSSRWPESRQAPMISAARRSRTDAGARRVEDLLLKLEYILPSSHSDHGGRRRSSSFLAQFLSPAAPG